MTMVMSAPLAVAVMPHAESQVHRPDVGAKDVGGRGGAEQTHGEDGCDQQFHGGLQASS